jgi:hypothetical protein
VQERVWVEGELAGASDQLVEAGSEQEVMDGWMDGRECSRNGSELAPKFGPFLWIVRLS